MKRETPKEVWLHHNKHEWTFSFDPPLKRFRPVMHRMVPAASVAALKAEVKRLRREAYDAVDRKLACLVFAGVLDAKKCEPLLLALRAALKPVRKAKR